MIYKNSRMRPTYGHHGDKLPEKRSGKKRKTERGLKTKPEHARNVRSRSLTPASKEAARNVKTYRETKHRKGKHRAGAELSLRKGVRERGRARSMEPGRSPLGRSPLSGTQPGIRVRKSTGTKTVTRAATKEEQEKQAMASLNVRLAQELGEGIYKHETSEQKAQKAAEKAMPSAQGGMGGGRGIMGFKARRPAFAEVDDPTSPTVDPAELYKHLGKQPELTAPLVQKKDRPEPEASPERQTVDLSSLEPVGTAEAERFRRGNVKADEERRARYPGKKRSRSDSPDTETPEAKRAREARVAAPTMPDERARQKREQEAKLAAGKVAYQEKMAELHAVGTARLEAQGQLRAKEQTQQQQYERGFEFTSKAGIHTEEREKLLKSEVPRQPMPAQKEVTFREQADPALASAERLAALKKSAETEIPREAPAKVEPVGRQAPFGTSVASDPKLREARLAQMPTYKGTLTEAQGQALMETEMATRRQEAHQKKMEAAPPVKPIVMKNPVHAGHTRMTKSMGYV